MPQITGITISVDFGDKEYGKGSESFMNMSAKWQDSENPTLDQVALQGLDMYFSAWQSMLAGRYATGVIKAEEFNQRFSATEKRFAQIRKFLQKEAADQHE